MRWLPACTTEENAAVVHQLQAHADGCHATVRLHDGRTIRGGVLWRPLTGFLVVVDPEGERTVTCHVDDVAAFGNGEAPTPS